MPKQVLDNGALDFGKRLVALLESAGQPRRGAGAYLARKYKVATVTANAWLNGEYKPNTDTARRIAVDHDSTFDQLYFGHQRDDELAPDERAMLDLWRSLDDDGRKAVKTVGHAFAKPPVDKAGGQD